MKARYVKKVGLGLVLSAMPFIGACNQQTSNAPQSLITAAQAEPLPGAATNAVLPTNVFAAPEFAPPPPETAPLPTPAPVTGKTLPPSIKPSSPVGEVAKLAQSGVDESVMLSYVNNSASMFNLASEEIIYLNDIGVPSGVVTAMIQRDQSLKQSLAENAQAQAIAAQANMQAAQAAAPTYETPAQPEPQPAETVAAAPQQPANVTYNYFYDSLSPYGTWVDVDGYGRCWQPTVVVINRGWRPYCDRGRWLYTDAGWYWQSDYSWGWATFHYGRWFSHPRWGWCWYPDYVWGPSWVSWRYSNDYCGWAPLPPAAYYRPGIGFYYHNRSVGFGFDFGLGASWFTFVPWGRFCDSRPWHHRVSGGHVTQVYNNTTIVNNFVTGNNNTVINRGVPIDHARRHAGREIREVTIRETRNLPERTARGERLERDGRTLVVHRPNIPQDGAGHATAPRHTRDSQVGHMPVGGAGAAAQLESPRGRDRTAMQTRERAAQPQSGTMPKVASPTPTQVNPSAVSSKSSPTVRDNRHDNSNRDRNKQNDGSPSVSPPIVRGAQQVAPTKLTPPSPSSTTINTPATQKPPASSVVVIGRKDSSPGQNRSVDNERRPTQMRAETPAHNSQTRSTPQSVSKSQPSINASRVESPRAPVSRSPETYFSTRSAPQTPRFERPASPRPTLAPSSSSPTYSAPRSTPVPSHSAPTYSVPRSSPAPSHSTPAYSAPRSAPTPSYTPAPSRSESRSMSAPSSERSSSSGRSDSSRRSRN